MFVGWLCRSVKYLKTLDKKPLFNSKKTEITIFAANMINNAIFYKEPKKIKNVEPVEFIHQIKSSGSFRLKRDSIISHLPNAEELDGFIET